MRHPNVVTIHGAEQIADQIGLWMEFVRGHTSSKSSTSERWSAPPSCRHRSRALSRDIGGAWRRPAASGYQGAQRDAAEDGRIVLMDFGTGRELDDDASSDLAGTPLYLAPEVLQGQRATVRSDIYSLGVLLYHLVTGSYPVQARTVREVRRAHERGERTAVQTARPDVPPKLARVIERAIDPAPSAATKALMLSPRTWRRCSRARDW